METMLGKLRDGSGDHGSIKYSNWIFSSKENRDSALYHLVIIQVKREKLSNFFKFFQPEILFGDSSEIWQN